MFYVYIIESEKDHSFYIGQTNDLEKRIENHNQGLSAYTRKKAPWKIVYNEIYKTRSEAIVRERFLKKQRNKEFYLSLINSKRFGSSAG
ncbi:GIY-YIG nuclease family protein [Flavobacteriaceae bacterium LMO-SS05]